MHGHDVVRALEGEKANGVVVGELWICGRGGGGRVAFSVFEFLVF